MANYDILGNIAIVKFHDDVSSEDRIKKAHEIMSQYKSVKTVLEKLDKVKGRLRTIKTKHLLGEKTLEALYHENDCIFKLNVETCYFSPRLAGERKEIADLILKESRNAKKRKKEKKIRILVMFAGVSPFSIVIAKNCRQIIDRLDSIELGKECCRYGLENVKLNKVFDIVNVIQGDVKKVIPKLLKKNQKKESSNTKYDFVLMPRPNLKDTFLKEGFSCCKKNGKIIYYGFCAEKALENMLEQLHHESKKCKKKIKIVNIKEAGDIAPYEHRYRIEISVLN
jgi:tRNA G37 N-methylase Trm5